MILYTKENNLFSNDRLTIFWTITKFCNYNCFYCSATPRSLTHPDEFMIYDIIDFIFNIPNNNIEIILTGGEFTTLPNILNYLNKISELSKLTNKKISIVLLSNFSKPVSFYEEIFEITKNLEYVYMYFSFHRELVSSEIFMKKYLEIYSKYKGFILDMAYMVHNQTCIDLFKKNIKKFPDIKYQIMPIFNSYILKDNNIKLTNNSIIKSNSIGIYFINGEYYYKYVNHNSISFNGFKCPSYSKIFSIDHNGFINTCVTWRNPSTLKYNDPNVLEILKNKPFVICNLSRCVCHPEIPKISTKHKHLIDIDIDYIKNNFKKIK